MREGERWREGAKGGGVQGGVAAREAAGASEKLVGVTKGGAGQELKERGGIFAGNVMISSGGWLRLGWRSFRCRSRFDQWLATVGVCVLSGNLERSPCSHGLLTVSCSNRLCLQSRSMF